MTVDLLSVRLKEAKKELTNLKTAHTRGIGMLQLYTSEVNLDVQGKTGIWDVAVTIYFKDGQSPYPFLEYIPIINNDTSNVIELIGMEFAEDGMSVLLQFEWLNSTPQVDTILLYCTSQIGNYTQEWSQ